MIERKVRASELAEFEFCQRAWWYARQGAVNASSARLKQGAAWHTELAQRTLATGCLRFGAYLLLLGAVVAMVVYLTTRLIG